MDLLLLGVLAVMILLLISQNRKRKREAELLVSSLEVGSEVLLHSGIKGKITKLLEESDIEIETRPGVKLTVVRQAVRQIVPAKEN
ncbi:MAG TPA: preprotein translocase subunit YajC [Aquiluna sp.]